MIYLVFTWQAAHISHIVCSSPGTLTRIWYSSRFCSAFGNRKMWRYAGECWYFSGMADSRIFSLLHPLDGAVPVKNTDTKLQYTSVEVSLNLSPVYEMFSDIVFLSLLALQRIWTRRDTKVYCTAHKTFLAAVSNINFTELAVSILQTCICAALVLWQALESPGKVKF